MKTDKLQLLIDNKLPSIEKKELISDIRNSPKLKQELALLMKIKEIGKQKTREILKEYSQKNNTSSIAKFSLAKIRRAAFGQNKGNNELTSLPIKDETMNDFLNDEDNLD